MATAAGVVDIDDDPALADDTGGIGIEELELEVEAALVDWKRECMRDSIELQVHGSAVHNIKVSLITHLLLMRCRRISKLSRQSMTRLLSCRIATHIQHFLSLKTPS